MQRKTDYDSIFYAKFDDVDEALRKKAWRECSGNHDYYDKALHHLYLEAEDDEDSIVSDAIHEALKGYIKENGELPAFMESLYYY